MRKIDIEKTSFRPSKWPRKLKTAKNSKLPKLPENCFELVGKGGWPPISTWINLWVHDTYMELEKIKIICFLLINKTPSDGEVNVT